MSIRNELRKVFSGEQSRLRQLREQISGFWAFECAREIERIRERIRNEDGDLALIPHGFKVFSQADEDGIIECIFDRIGERHRTFLEIGAGTGLENNTLYLLLKGWRGVWVEASPKAVTHIRRQFSRELNSQQLRLMDQFLTRENLAEALIEPASRFLGEEIDLLSIDLDGNDYHLLAAWEGIRPRVIVLEYNPRFGPRAEWVMKYNANHQWDGSDYYGASLKSFEKLLTERGYGLVGCNITGNNAFFVRADDLDRKLFLGPPISERHFQPARFELTRGFKLSGHETRFWGERE